MPKYIGADNATRHPSATQNIMGFLYPTKNITITTLVTHTSNTGTYSTGTSPQRMVLVSFPSLDSIVATVVARTADDSSLWTGSSSTYARALQTPVSYTLLKGTKYAIVCLSGSSANFDIRGRTYNNADTFNFTSTYDLQIGGTYNSSSDLAIGATFNVSPTGASNVPYVSAL
jgi:hypothetical protein